VDATELLTRDHREVEELFSQYKGGDDDARRTAAEDLIRELSVHAVIEEQIFYPEVRRELADTEGMVEHGIDEHQEVKEILASMDDSIDKAHTKAFAHKVERLEKAVTEHVQEEEEELFPRVREGMTKKRLGEMGSAMAEAKKAAPTRPHPGAPSTPPGNIVAGTVASVVDRVRDAVSGRQG
jgi:hemerythrin superfamily protein